jgi:hypothetical protein
MTMDLIPQVVDAIAYRQRRMAACFWIMQVTGFVASLLCVAFVSPNVLEPWVRIGLLGILLATCCLTSAGTVRGAWPIWARLLSGAAIVIGCVVSFEIAEDGLRFEETPMIALFGLALWSIIQCPFWIARFVLRARVVSGSVSDADSTARSQFGIRALMLLTFVVAIALGTFRLLVSQQTLEELRNMTIAIWMLMISIAAALALTAVTTTITTLNSTYWKAGIAVSFVASVVLAIAVYSISSTLMPSPREEFLFGGMIIAAYGWLQISLLLVRAAGYRILVRR